MRLAKTNTFCLDKGELEADMFFPLTGLLQNVFFSINETNDSCMHLRLIVNTDFFDFKMQN